MKTNLIEYSITSRSNHLSYLRYVTWFFSISTCNLPNRQINSPGASSTFPKKLDSDCWVVNFWWNGHCKVVSLWFEKCPTLWFICHRNWVTRSISNEFVCSWSWDMLHQEVQRLGPKKQFCSWRGPMGPLEIADNKWVCLGLFHPTFYGARFHPIYKWIRS